MGTQSDSEIWCMFYLDNSGTFKNQFLEVCTRQNVSSRDPADGIFNWLFLLILNSNAKVWKFCAFYEIRFRVRCGFIFLLRIRVRILEVSVRGILVLALYARPATSNTNSNNDGIECLPERSLHTGTNVVISKYVGIRLEKRWRLRDHLYVSVFHFANIIPRTTDEKPPETLPEQQQAWKLL